MKAVATGAAGDHGRPGAVYIIGGGSRVTMNHVRDTFADTARARAELGFSPSYSLESGLAAESEWLASVLPTPLR